MASARSGFGGRLARTRRVSCQEFQDGSTRPSLDPHVVLTDFTPATPRATVTAWSMSAWDPTKPLSWTTPLNVSTLISLTFRVASLRIAAFTFVVITESSTYSPVPSRDCVAPHPQLEASNKRVRSKTGEIAAYIHGRPPVRS
jgi:hypothetical protein